MTRVNYTEFAGGFNQVVLEESFVLNLKTTMSFVDFQMNFAVNESYPLYVPPEPVTALEQPDFEEEYELEIEGETDEESPHDSAPPTEATESEEEAQPRYPYRRGRIFFPNMEQVRWQSRIQPYIDPRSGSVDYGSIDYFYQGEDGRYFLAGYWGELEVQSGPPILEVDELKQHQQNQQQQRKDTPA